MKKEEITPRKFISLSNFHREFGLPPPLHPLISFVAIDDMKIIWDEFSDSLILDFY